MSPSPELTFDLGIAPDAPAQEVAELAREVEALGFGGLWIADSQSLFREAFSVLAATAVHTDSIRVGPGVSNVVTRHPAVVASAAATLAELAPGRFVLGLSTGASAVHTVGARPSRLDRLEQAVTAIRALVRGEPATWNGSRLEMRWASAEVPVYLAASAPRALELAGRIADGVIVQAGAEPALIEHAFERVRAGARAAGRAPDAIELCARVGCIVDRDRERARAAMRGYAVDAAKTVFGAVPADRLPGELVAELERLDAGYDWQAHGSGGGQAETASERLIDAFAVAGDPEDVAAGFDRLRRAGVRKVVVRGARVRDAARFARTLAHGVFPLLS